MGFNSYSNLEKNINGMVDMEKIGFLFPGQGAQFIGMGKDLCERYDVAEKVFDQANEILGYDLKSLCFSGTEEELTKTRIAQPAIFVTSVAVLEILKQEYPELRPCFVAGLSLGEFSALVGGGALTYEDGLRLVQRRAEAMERAAQNNPGTMASIMGLSETDCHKVSKDAGCEVANLNAYDQIVLSGTKESILKACELAEKAGAKRAIPLKVGGAFHSTLMKDAKEELQQAIADTQISEPACLFVPNATGELVSSPTEIGALLATQLMSSVRWVDTLAQAEKAGVRDFIEVGPGKVLKGLARRYSKELSVTSCGTVDDVEQLKKLFFTHEG